jgi:hypothetical protein
VPWETLKPFLSSEGAKIFGGARPKDDDDGTRLRPAPSHRRERRRLGRHNAEFRASDHMVVHDLYIAKVKSSARVWA